MKPSRLQDAANVSQHSNECRFCKNVTFYEDFADAIRVLDNFNSIIANFSADLPVHATLAGYCMLADPELNSIIIENLRCVDVIVVATNGDRKLPGQIASWVEICTHANPARKPAILELHYENLEEQVDPAPLCTSLNGVAVRVNATFMSNRHLASNQPDLPAKVIHVRWSASNLETVRTVAP